MSAHHPNFRHPRTELELPVAGIEFGIASLGEEAWITHRIAPAALSSNTSVSRMYRCSMASEAWPVCCLIFQDDTPARAALVTKPDRKLWPEKPHGSMSAFLRRNLTMSDTACPDKGLCETEPCRSTVLKIGPSLIPASSNQVLRAFTGQKRPRANGTPIIRPRPV